MFICKGPPHRRRLSGKIRLLNWQDRVASWTFFFEVQFQCPMVEASPSARAAATAPVLLPGISVKVSAEVLRLAERARKFKLATHFFYKICQDMLCWKISAVMRYQVLWTLLKDDIAKIYLAHLGTIGRHEWFGIQSLRQLRRHKTSGKQKTWNDFTETHDWRYTHLYRWIQGDVCKDIWHMCNFHQLCWSWGVSTHR